MHGMADRATSPHLPAAPSLVFKVADSQHEFDQIARLQYATFVEEIPQHPANSDRLHVDRFHDENTYLICLDGTDLLGTLALRDRRPFALERRLADLDSYLPPCDKPCEIRLLAARTGHRSGRVFLGLARLLARHCTARGFDLAVISATLRQPRLYRHLGFVPFGPQVGTEGAMYQPMYLTPRAFHQHVVPVVFSDLGS